jgi:hypothetical protein
LAAARTVSDSVTAESPGGSTVTVFWRFYGASRATGKLKLLLGGFRVPVED